MSQRIEAHITRVKSRGALTLIVGKYIWDAYMPPEDPVWARGKNTAVNRAYIGHDSSEQVPLLRALLLVGPFPEEVYEKVR